MLLLDDIDKDWLQSINFNFNKKPCSYGYIRFKRTRLHRLILERKLGRPIKLGYVCDHINRNKLDNRRENLRESTILENNLNSIKHKLGKYQGYTYLKSRNKWQAQIKINGKQKYLGIFKTEEEAHNRYLQELKILNKI
jgi:hypothetical protein